MTVDLTPLCLGVDASAVLQAALDAGGPVDIPPSELTLGHPVYLPPGCDLSGRGASLRAVNHDALIAMPDAQRWYVPTPHLVPNTVDGTRFAFRSRGTAGLRFWNTPGDVGRTGGFAAEMHVERHGGHGGLCGSAWHSGNYRPAPWYLQQHGDHAEWLDFRLAVVGKPERSYRFRVGPTPTDFHLRIRVDPGAGAVAFEVDGIPLSGADVQAHAPLAAGDVLQDNPGAPLWVGGLSHQAGGMCPPELGSADVTFHSFRIWSTATPPTGGYDPFTTFPGTAFVLPFSAPPVAGDPAVFHTGAANGYGYLTPTAAVDNAWCVGVRVRDLELRGADYGAGLSIVSAVDVDVSSLRIDRFAVGLQVLGGPLPCYPVRIRDVWAFHQADAAIRLQRCIARTVDGITAKYPARSVLRADDCGAVVVRDVFHAGENGSEANTVTDCFRFDGCHVVELSGVLSNYEDGWGPRNSYVWMTGAPPDSAPQVYRIHDFGRQALRPGGQYLDTTGLPGNAVGTVTNSF